MDEQLENGTKVLIIDNHRNYREFECENFIGTGTIISASELLNHYFVEDCNGKTKLYEYGRGILTLSDYVCDVLGVILENNNQIREITEENRNGFDLIEKAEEEIKYMSGPQKKLTK